MLGALLLALTIQSGDPQVPAPFADAVRRVEADGHRLKTLWHGSLNGRLDGRLDGSGEHLVAVFRAAPDSGHGEWLHIYEAGPSGPRRLLAEFRQSEAFALEAPVEDLTGDGRPEIVVGIHCGGTAWACQRVAIYQIRSGTVRDLTSAIEAPLIPVAVEDIDGDRIAEVVALDTRWETYPHLPHPTAPRSEAVFAWRNGEYRRASPQYRTFYELKIDRLESQLEATRDMYDYLGYAASLLLYRREAGHTADAWSRFEQQLAAPPPEVAARREWYDIRGRLLVDLKR